MEGFGRQDLLYLMVWKVLGGSMCCILCVWKALECAWKALGGSIRRILRVWKALGGSICRILRVWEGQILTDLSGPKPT